MTWAHVKASRAMREGKRRLQSKRIFRRFCGVPTCPGFAAPNSGLCTAHRDPYPAEPVPEPAGPVDQALPFEVTP